MPTLFRSSSISLARLLPDRIPSPAANRIAFRMSTPRRHLFLLAALAAPLSFASAQSSATSEPVQAPTEALRPALNQIGEAIAGLNVTRWKAPGEVRVVAQRDIDSIHRDLSSTLPPLLDQAKTTPASTASSFAVYRNIDAVYDVLLRVSETATLAGSPADAKTMQATLTALEAARRDLGDAILRVSESHEQELLRLRSAAQAAAAAAAVVPAPPKTTVVDDGPAAPPAKPSPSVRRKKKPVATTTAGPAPTAQ